MRRFFKYLAIFIVAVVVLQLVIFDSMHPWIYFAPLAYVAFIVLLPLGTRPVSMLVLGLLTGIFVDFFEGTGGLHTAVTLFTAYIRRYEIMLTLGRDALDSDAMPSVRLLGVGKFVRYSSLAVSVHCLLFFMLESLTWYNIHLVLLKTVVGAVVTMLAVWAVSMLFSTKKQKMI
jgi:hypothetical protein